jgi:hypothetical protein
VTALPLAPLGGTERSIQVSIGIWRPPPPAMSGHDSLTPLPPPIDPERTRTPPSLACGVASEMTRTSPTSIGGAMLPRSTDPSAPALVSQPGELPLVLHGVEDSVIHRVAPLDVMQVKPALPSFCFITLCSGN